MVLLRLVLLAAAACASREAKRLHDDLLSDYNRLIRPVGNHSHKVTIVVGLKLSQLIDINLKHQVMTTNIWLEQEWEDDKLRWNPEDYGGVDMIHVPAESLWLPDIVLFNNADGNYEVILMNKATVYSTGKVVWKPPALYKSTCEIDVEYFPFDEQNCLMKFGSWTYDGLEVDLQHVKQRPGVAVVETGIDMSEFYKSVEWDILRVPAKYNNEFYDCCEEPFPDITFNITMRRKTLFYTVNLIIPCVTLCISILVSLTVFFLLLAEIIPPTSLAVPLLGKYLLFTMILVTLSISVTVGVLNVHFRSPSTHRMAPWVRRVWCPPSAAAADHQQSESPEAGSCTPEVRRAIDSVLFIADHIRKEDDDESDCEDWKYVAMVLDRLFLWIFTLASLVGTCGIILQAPSLYDTRLPIDVQMSHIGREYATLHAP
ncbi:hypothetical protein MRX96_003933 [Rhipicephalus microplus]